MRTDQLIAAMEADTTRTRPVSAVLPAAVLLGMLAIAILFLPAMGMRPDLGAAIVRVQVMVKQAVPVLVAVGAFGAAVRLSRPGSGMGGWALVLAAVPALLAVTVASELMILPRPDWMPAMMGSSNGQCVGFITVMSLPLLAGTLWALRRGASTRPVLSGAIAGLLSGGAAAIVYSIHCTEDNPLFYAVWYIIAILVATALGALLGSRLLRW